MPPSRVNTRLSVAEVANHFARDMRNADAVLEARGVKAAIEVDDFDTTASYNTARYFNYIYLKFEIW